MILHDSNAVRRSLEDVDAALERPVETYMIGGGALSLRGLKDATKDIDHVVATEEAYRILAKGLRGAHFRRLPKTELKGPYPALAARSIYVKDDHPQWDVFVAVVAGKLRLSPGMMNRAKPLESQLSKLKPHLIANEDILVFKSVAGRVGDLEDMERILLVRPDWNVVLDEMRWQCRHSDTAWSGMFHDAMAELAERYSVPILEALADLADQDVLDKQILQAIRRGASDRAAIEARFRDAPDDIGHALERLLADRWILERDGRITAGPGPLAGQ